MISAALTSPTVVIAVVLGPIDLAFRAGWDSYALVATLLAAYFSGSLRWSGWAARLGMAMLGLTIVQLTLVPEMNSPEAMWSVGLRELSTMMARGTLLAALGVPRTGCVLGASVVIGLTVLLAILEPSSEHFDGEAVTLMYREWLHLPTIGVWLFLAYMQGLRPKGPGAIARDPTRVD